MEKKAKDNEGTRCNLNPPHLFFEAKKVDHFLMFRITPPKKTNMDTQNDATFEAGDTFQKPSFLVSMSDFGGKFIVSFARCFLKEISYIKRLLWFGQELFFSVKKIEKANLELEFSKVEPLILIWCFFNSKWPTRIFAQVRACPKPKKAEPRKNSTTHLFRVRLGNKLCGSTLIHRGKSGRTGEVSVGPNKTGNKILKRLEI